MSNLNWHQVSCILENTEERGAVVKNILGYDIYSLLINCLLDEYVPEFLCLFYHLFTLCFMIFCSIGFLEVHGG